MKWPTDDPLEIEMECIRRGGRWKLKSSGRECGEGLLEHYLNMQLLIWPRKKVHRWTRLVLGEMVRQRILGIMGAASTGKTFEAALYALTTYYVFPEETTVLCASTTREMLEMRIWGEIKKHHNIALARYPDLPGRLLESRQRIITTDEEMEGRDFRAGLCGVPCKPGGNYVGLGDYVGIKNKRVILIADESQFMPGAFVDAISNLNKNQGFQCFALGNPKDRTDALGKVCEPDDADGGWDSVDDREVTKNWRTRWNNGMCIQLVGTDSPNMDVPEGQPVPYPFLISRQSIEDDAKFYGRDSLQFSMMNLGTMPKETTARRVITRALCVKFNAMEEPIWSGGKLTKIGALDAAYASVGGDRCVFIELNFGPDKDGKIILAMVGSPSIIQVKNKGGLPEEQIATQVKEICENRGIEPAHMFFDSTGRGSLALAFARLWSNSVVGVEFGGRPTDRQVSAEIKKTCREYYGKFVTELWYSARLAIEAGQCRGLHEDVMAEGCMREWTMISGGKIDVEPKEKTKIRMGRSPDLFDAYVTGVEGARRLGFKIAKLGGDRVNRNERNWLDELAGKAERLAKHRSLTYR